MKYGKKVLAAALSACMLLGMSACGADMEAFLEEVRKVGEWDCYETTTAISLSIEAEESADLGFSSAQGEIALQYRVDTDTANAELSGGFEAGVEGLDTYGARTDIHTEYALDPVYVVDGVLYAPLKLICDMAELGGTYGAEDAVRAQTEAEYAAVSLGDDAEALVQMVQEAKAGVTPERYGQLGQLLAQYATGLQVKRTGRSYTMSGEISQLPGELISLYGFFGQHIQELNDVLQLGMDGEELVQAMEAAQEMNLNAEDLAQLQTEMESSGVAGDFSVTVSFEDGKMTTAANILITVQPGLEIAVNVQKVTAQRAFVTVKAPESSESMSFERIESLMNGWSEETVGTYATVDLHSQWVDAAYWDGDAPVFTSVGCPVVEQEGQYLVGFRAVMESLGYGADYDAATDTVFFVDKDGARTPVALYEENGRSYISAEQLGNIGFDAWQEDGDYPMMYIFPRGTINIWTEGDFWY